MDYETPSKSLTFDSFVTSPENLTAVQTAILMAENGSLPGGGALLYVYGDRGVGKTHLLNAIANAACGQGAVLVDVVKLRKTCEQAWARGDHVDLEERFIEPDLLLLDNIDASVEHEEFQSHLLGGVEARLSAGLGVVVSSRVPPSRLKVYRLEHEPLLGGGGIVSLKWADKNFQTLIMRSLPGAEAVPDEALASLLGEEIKDGHALLTLALGLQAKPEIRRLLTQLGYSLRSVRRTQSDRGVYLISHWRMEWEGRIHVVDVAYSLKNRSVATRCWSLRQL